MVVDRHFSPVTARHVASGDDVHVSFPNANELEYRIGPRAIRLQAERVIADDGAPDGRIVTIDDHPRWNDGQPLTADEHPQIIADLQAASGPLRSKLRFG